MKPNIGNADAIVRIVIAMLITIFALYYQSWWGLLALVPFVTASMFFCPLYKLLHISTCPRKSAETGEETPAS